MASLIVWIRLIFQCSFYNYLSLSYSGGQRASDPRDFKSFWKSQVRWRTHMSVYTFQWKDSISWICFSNKVWWKENAPKCPLSPLSLHKTHYSWAWVSYAQRNYYPIIIFYILVSLFIVHILLSSLLCSKCFNSILSPIIQFPLHSLTHKYRFSFVSISLFILKILWMKSGKKTLVCYSFYDSTFLHEGKYQSFYFSQNYRFSD